MPAPQITPARPEHVSTQPVVSETQMAFLNRLRFQAVTCRALARLDFFATCAVIDPKSDLPEQDRVALLLRLLGQALPRDPVFHRPGEKKISFDERWLMAVVDADARGDHDSLAFLIGRRVEPAKQRLFWLLVSGLGPLALSA